MLVVIYTDVQEWAATLTLHGSEVTALRYTIVRRMGADGFVEAWAEAAFLQGWEEFQQLHRLRIDLGLLLHGQLERSGAMIEEAARAVVQEAADLVGIQIGHGAMRLSEELRPKGGG